LRKPLCLVLTSAALGLLALAPATAYADPGNGAQKINEHVCYGVGSDFTLCFTNRGELNNTLTPSGNYMVEENLAFLVEGAGPASSYRDSGRFHEHFLYKDGSLQELQSRQRETLSIRTPDFNADCTFYFTYHEANGQVQYRRVVNVCTPV